MVNNQNQGIIPLYRNRSEIIVDRKKKGDAVKASQCAVPKGVCNATNHDNMKIK